MPLSIRLATLNDAEGITEVHCSDVNRWYKIVNGRKVEAKYDELTVEDRFRHGGPWMSVETCAIHLNYMLTSGQYPIIAELNGKIVGELELYIGEDRGILGKTGFIDILYVHRDFRRRGIGRMLIAKAQEIAVSEGCDTLSVWPEEDAIPFYRKCGLDKVAYRIINLSIDLKKIEKVHAEYEVLPFPSRYDMLRDFHLITPRIYSSFAAWLKSRWEIALRSFKIKFFEGYSAYPESTFIIECWREDKVASIYLWLKDESYILDMLCWLLWKAKNMGFMKACILINDHVYDYIKNKLPVNMLGNEVILMMKIKEKGYHYS